MASFLDQNFDDEEEEDFNPQAEVGSDQEDDEKPQVISDDEKEPSVNRSRSRTRPVDEDDEVKEEDGDKDGVVGFDREDDEEGDANGEDEDPEQPGDDEDEDEEEEEEDEEDDDIEGQPSRKRRKRQRRNQFIDVEAEVDEEDEEEPEEDDDLPGEEVHPDDLQDLPPGADRDDRKHRELDQQRERAEQMDVEETARQLKERYGRQARGTGAAGAVVPQHLLLPGTDDPRIWRFKCRPGKEKEIIMNLNERIVSRMNSRDPIKILSAFQREGVMAGNLYIEAWRQEDIMPALDGVSHVFMGTKPTMISLEEMPDLLRTKRSKQLEPGMYVRVRRGLYLGDLAQVVDVESNGTTVDLRLVPRLAYGMDEDANAPAEVDAAGKRKRPVKANTQRPPPRLFSETEAKKKHGKYLARAPGLGPGNSWTYQNKSYLNGFLLESFRVNALQTENVNPTLEEVTKFAAGAEDGTENLDLAALAATLKASTAADYLPGDKVELFRGEQKGVTGSAVEVYGDVVKMRIDSTGALRGKTIEAPIKDLRKLFREGDHVKVIGGSKYFDEVGMVVKTKDDRVTFLTDSNQQEVTVFSKDLREATDSGGNVAGSKYDLFDLVQLDAATVGCVIKVDRESLRVLDQTGSVRTMLPSAISNKLERRKMAVATDHDGNEMKIEDTIKEFGGEQKQGRVLHLHRNYVFAQNRERAENAGVFVARHSNVVTVAAKGGRQPGQNGVDLTKMNPALKQNGGPGMDAMAPPQQKGRDRLIGKTVKIRTGQNKGMIGIVKDAGDVTAKVELHAKNKQITINKEHLTAINAHDGSPLHTSQQPGGAAGRTPAPSSSFARTPAYAAPSGARTPAYAMASGGRTPTWKQDAGAKTPAYGGATAYGGGGFGGATAYGGGGMTSYGGATSYGGGGAGGGSVWGGHQSTWNPNASSRTPAHNPGNKTPAYGGLEAPTPGFSAPTPGNYADQPTPGGFRGQYQTPAAYQTPGGFPETPGAGYDDDGPKYD
ncbi:transcription elongation factor spt5 [Vermiconidia calcicola]|uniref:Transcription elongation factor spt5 n=1 Tax=Vermiconidia calcicola TaxID=1690605 RepID=A0ACC3MS91_9PEZI|nr:transcription elongation factor spt5 [Vermiconidia calcicola]